jgi:membrane protein
MSSDPGAVSRAPETAALSAALRKQLPAPRVPSFVRRLWLTAGYLMRTEVHTFAFSVAANAILSFFPFMVLLMTLIRRVFHSKAMYDVVVALLRDYLPTGQDFIVRNLNVLIYARQRAALASLIILLITSTGVFLPLEVALNKIWGFPHNRSYLGNLLVSLGLAFGCGCLALLSIGFSAGHRALLLWITRGEALLPVRVSAFLIMKTCALLTTIVIFFLIYWILPNGKTPARAVLPAAIVVGLTWEVLKYGYILLLPWLNFGEVYGPFSISVTLMFWAFLSGLLLLGGAHLSAAEHV